MNTPMTIDNAKWSIEKLFNNRHIITKPKFQRDKKWTPLPKKKGNSPNYKDYIEFLIENKNSVFPISLGTRLVNNEKKYIVIDGNNRINAIISFLEKPYQLFSKLYEQLFTILNSQTGKYKEQLKETVKNMNYRQLDNFRRLDDIINLEDYQQQGLTVVYVRDLEDELTLIQKKLKHNDGTSFLGTIILNINIFEDGTFEDYCRIFESINKHANSLSENELLSAILYNIHVSLHDSELEEKVKFHIRTFYEHRSQDEVLEKYVFDSQEPINVFDFMVGFQNYCHEQYHVIPTFESKGLSLFFRMFKNLYSSEITPDSFSPEVIRSFIEQMIYSSEIFSKAYSQIFPDNVNPIIFNSSQVTKINNGKMFTMTPLLLILTTIISNRQNLSETNLVSEIKATIIYHFICNKSYLNHLNEEKLNWFRQYNKISLMAGGTFINEICRKIMETDKNKIFIDKSNLQKLLTEGVLGQIKNKSDTNRSKQRRQLNILDKILICNYWNVNIANKFLNDKYSIEHICPFSSTWEQELDIDRLGNIFPTIDNLNKKRGNHNFKIYQQENNSFYKAVEALVPIDYDDYNSYSVNGTKIVSRDKFNQVCEKNEQIYISELIHNLY